VTKDDKTLVGVQLLVRAGWDIAHRHWHGAFNVRCRDLPRLADVDETGLVLTKKRCCVGRGNFKFEHETSLKPSPGVVPPAGQMSARAASEQARIELIA
jgi:hypothetical protein